MFDCDIMNNGGLRICCLRGIKVTLHNFDVMKGESQQRFDISFEPLFDRPLVPKTLVPLSAPNLSLARTSDSLHILPFHAHEEIQIQRQLGDLRAQGCPGIWIVASAGLEGGAARGFSRSLRNELSPFIVRLAVFDVRWTEQERHAILNTISTTVNLPAEIDVDTDGRILSPRFKLSIPPSRTSPLQSHIHWSFTGTDTVQVDPDTHIPAGHVLVRFLRVAPLPSQARFRGFVGDVMGAGTTQYPPGMRVFGVHVGSLANIAPVHEGSVMIAPTDRGYELANFAVACILANLTLGPGAFPHSNEPHETGRILVTHQESVESHVIFEFLQSCGLQPQFCDLKASAILQLRKTFEAGDMIVSGASDDEARLLSSALCTTAVQVCMWRKTASTLETFLNDHPWFISNTLRSSLPISNRGHHFSSPILLHPRELIPNGARILPTSLFNPSKIYLLVGGIGSLGLALSVWMFQVSVPNGFGPSFSTHLWRSMLQNGARRVVLTSRSGRQSLSRPGFTSARRMLGYLEGMPQLEIRLEACDASDSSSMRALLASIAVELGGCFLLSYTLSDRLFLSHTAESYATPWVPKVVAFEVLDSLVSIENLEFLVCVSSAAGFGGPGQSNYAR